MDRSFLFHPTVVKASRNFICVRLISYENESETKFIQSLSPNRIENTAFGILSPLAKPLTTISRSPHQIASDAHDLAKMMNKIATANPSKPGLPNLPMFSNLRIAINIASSDELRLIVVNDQTMLAPLKTLLWKKNLIGRYLITIARPEELHLIEADESQAKATPIMIVVGNKFGLGASVVASFDKSDKPGALEDFLAEQVAIPRYDRDFWDHVAAGQTEGVFWTTKLPVTDPQEKMARQRSAKQRRPR